MQSILSFSLATKEKKIVSNDDYLNWQKEL
jgi:hypothetical protein